jgi:hypothetical protein
MTTTMNIPNKLYKQANETAQLLGVSDMELYLIAIEQYIREQKTQKGLFISLKPQQKIVLSGTNEEFSPSVKSILGAFKITDVNNMSLYYKDEINAVKDER